MHFRSKFFSLGNLSLLLLSFERVLLSTASPARYCRGRCWAVIWLSHCPEPSDLAVRGEVDGLDIGGQHGRRFVLRHTHRPQRRTYPICTSRSGNVRHRCGGGWAEPRLFLGGSFRWWVPVPGIKMLSLVGLSVHSAFHWWSAHCVARMLLLSEKLMSCCAAGTNGCFDLRRRASALDGRSVSMKTFHRYETWLGHSIVLIRHHWRDKLRWAKLLARRSRGQHSIGLCSFTFFLSLQKWKIVRAS